MMQVRKTKIFPPLIVLVSMLLMWLLDKYFPLVEITGTHILGLVVLVFSFLTILYCAYLFHKNNTAIKPFEMSSFLILSWPYTMSRNPIYLSMVILLIGWGLWLGSLSVFIIIPLFFAWIQFRFVKTEEAILAEQFKNEYSNYTSSVRRWL